MAAAGGTTDAPPVGIAALAERWDPDVIDLPNGRALIRLDVAGETAWEARVRDLSLELVRAGADAEPDAVIAADAATWRRIAEDPRGAMGAFQQRRLRMRGSLHVGVGFLAATGGSRDPGRLAFERIKTGAGRLSIVAAGSGPETLLCLHGLGGTKASFLPTLAALAGPDYRVVALDLPGFGESDKPIGAPYDARWFAGVGLRGDGRARTRLRSPRGQQHGRPGGRRSGSRRSRARAVADAPVPCARLASRPSLGPDREAAAARARPAADGAAAGRRADDAPAGARRPATAGRQRGWTSSCAPT